MYTDVGYVSGLRDVSRETSRKPDTQPTAPHHTRPTTCKPKRQVSQAATISINLELLKGVYFSLAD